MIATDDFFHIQPSSYCSASAPVAHVVMVPTRIIILFVGFKGASDLTECRREPPPLALGHLQRADTFRTPKMFERVRLRRPANAKMAMHPFTSRVSPAARRIFGRGPFIFQKYPKTTKTIKLHKNMAIILAQIEVSNKFIIFCPLYDTKWSPKGAQHGQNNKYSLKGGHGA
jgi:hypothetical protein